MNKVTNIKNHIIELHTNKDLVSGMSYIIDEAINGRVQGSVLALRRGKHHHEIMILGEYNEDPYSALRALKKLREAIDEKAEELERYSEIDFQY